MQAKVFVIGIYFFNTSEVIKVQGDGHIRSITCTWRMKQDDYFVFLEQLFSPSVSSEGDEGREHADDSERGDDVEHGLASFEVVEQVHAQQAGYKGTATHNEC